MAVIKPKRTSTASNVPTTSDIEVGEIAINLADKQLFVRDTSDNIFDLTEVVSDASPQLGGNLDGQSYDITTTGELSVGTASFGSANITTFDSSSNWYYSGNLNLLTDNELVFDNYSYSDQTKINHDDSALNITQTNSNAKVKITGGAGLDLEGEASVESLSINDEFTFPTTDGASDQILQTDGAGNITWVDLPGGVDLGAVGEHILPTTTETYDLGSASKRFRDLYLSGNTINLAGATISSDGTGTITISATGATLPENSKMTVGNTTNNLALAGEAGEVVVAIPFYSKAGGLSTENTKLSFRANTNRVVANFTLSDGTQVQSSSDTLFFL